MKVSIWQQFSSNHSAGFVIVGTFNSIKQATDAKKELQNVLERVSVWLDTLSHDEARNWYYRAEATNQITPEEHKLQSEYGMLWEHSLLSYQSLLHLGERIEVRENHVIVEELNGTTWYGPQPLNTLLKHMGATVSMEVWESKIHTDNRILVNLSCNLPDDAIQADSLFLRFQKDFTAYKSDPNRVYQSDTDDDLEGLPFNYEHLSGECFDDSIALYEVERKGNQLILSGVAFWAFQSWTEDLDVLVSYLKNENCTSIQYTFYSVECKDNK